MVKRLLLLVMLMSGCMVANAQADSDKDFISQTSKDLVNQWDTEAFQNVLNLLNQLFSYNTEEISVWGSNAIKATKTAITTPYKGITEGKMLMIRPSTFTGHFNVVNNRWVYQGAADDLQFSFKDQEGNSCLALITSSGNTQTITLTYEYVSVSTEAMMEGICSGMVSAGVTMPFKATNTLSAPALLRTSCPVYSPSSFALKAI